MYRYVMHVFLRITTGFLQPLAKSNTLIGCFKYRATSAVATNYVTQTNTAELLMSCAVHTLY